MREVPLSKGLVALVDDKDFALVSQYTWHAHKGPKDHTHYAIAYVRGGGGRRVKMHRLLLGAKAGQLVDHEDRNGINNQRHNLRFATPSQNQFNHAKSADKYTSKFKGVYWCKRDRKWISMLRHEGKRISGGRFDSELEAAAAYNALVNKVVPVFAHANTL